MCCDGLGSISNLESLSSLFPAGLSDSVMEKSTITELSNKIKGQDFFGHMYKCDSHGISKQLFPYMQTPSNAVIFGVLYCMKLYNNDLAVRKGVKSSPLTQAHLLTQTLEAPIVKSPHLSQINLKSGSGAAKGVETAHTEGAFA